MPDQYTTTADPLREMICFYCQGHFSGTSATNEKLFRGTPVYLCDNCLRQAADA